MSLPIIIATDIHGTSDAIRMQWRSLGDDLTWVSPWDMDGCPHPSEAAAVQAFHAQNGLQAYADKIAQAADQRPALLIGFSVGATSMWLHAGSPRCDPQSRARLYYGSRIRDHLAVTPRCAVSLVFAEHEPSFEPAGLVAQLHQAGAQASIIPNTSHGFMNPHAQHHQADLVQAQIEQLKRWVACTSLPPIASV
jgi:dienelactone hydrolase